VPRPTPTREPDSKGADTHRNILRAALAFASEFGLGGVSIGALAERTRMSKSGLFAHFDSKENLQLAILQNAIVRFTDEVVAPALKKPRGEPRVRALFDLWLGWSKAEFMPGGCIFVAAAVELDDKPGPLRDLLKSAQIDWFETLSTAAQIAIREGHFRPNLDTELFAHEVYALAYGHHFIARLLRMRKAEERTMQSFERLLADAAVTHAPSRERLPSAAREAIQMKAAERRAPQRKLAPAS
jgi:AcrR family transcriptional regulator